MLFEMATGKRPFESETPYSIAVMQVMTQPPAPRTINPTITTAIESVILKSLRKKPDQRYSSAEEMATALKMAIERPSSVHDTEPNMKKATVQPPQPQPVPQQVHAVMQSPPTDATLCTATR